MSPPPSVDRLADRRYLTVLLRFVLSAQQELVYGEIVNADGGVCDRFQRWENMLALLQICLGLSTETEKRSVAAAQSKRRAARKPARPKRKSKPRKAS